MKKNPNIIRTPRGAMLGERIWINGSAGLHYKAGKLEDDLTPEQMVECISGIPVEQIIYKDKMPGYLKTE